MQSSKIRSMRHPNLEQIPGIAHTHAIRRRAAACTIAGRHAAPAAEKHSARSEHGHAPNTLKDLWSLVGAFHSWVHRSALGRAGLGPILTSVRPSECGPHIMQGIQASTRRALQLGALPMDDGHRSHYVRALRGRQSHHSLCESFGERKCWHAGWVWTERRFRDRHHLCEWAVCDLGGRALKCTRGGCTCSHGR